MARPIDMDRRIAIETKFREFKKAHLPGDPDPWTQTANYFNVSTASIRYNLRDPSKGDMRRRFPKETLEKLSIMDGSERKAYAEARGVSMQSIRNALYRYHKRIRLNKVGGAFRFERIQRDNFFNFGSRLDLYAVNQTLERVQDVRKILKGMNGLALRSPNLLYHPPTRRVYRLSYTEQIAILKDPRKYLRSRAEHIARHWETKPEMKDFLTDLLNVDGVGVTPSYHIPKELPPPTDDEQKRITKWEEALQLLEAGIEEGQL